MADPEAPQTPGRPPEPAGSLPPESQPPRPRKSRWRRRLLWGVGALLLLLIVLVALGPTLLSTGPGTSLVEKFASRQVDGRMRLEGLSVGWFSGISVSEMEVYDQRETQVLALANFQSDLTLWNALRGKYALGDASGRLNLTVVHIYDDGTTNLHEVFRIEPTPEDEEAAIPDITGRLMFDGFAGVQYMGKRDVTGDESAPVDVTFDGTEIMLVPGQPLEHNIPLALRVNGQPAGDVLAKGSVDLATLSAERPVIQEEVTLRSVSLPAIGTLLAAFVPQMSEIDISSGVIDGMLSADLAQNRLGGRITGTDRIVINRRDVPGQGYETGTFELVLDGGFSSEPLPAEQQVTRADGSIVSNRLLVDLDQLSLTTDDGTLTAAAVIDLFILQTDPLANWPALARDVSLEVKTGFATARGQAANLGALSLEGAADISRMYDRFGNLLAAGGAQPTQGQARFLIKTQQAEDGSISVPVSLNLDNLVLADLEQGSATGGSPAGANGQQAQTRPPGAISADPQQLARQQQTVAAKQPLRLGAVRLDATATLPPPQPGVVPMPTGLEAQLAVHDAERQPIVTAQLGASDLSTSSTAGRIALENLSLPDYARLRATLDGWIDLPEPREPVEPITMTAAATWDGQSGALELVEPLRVLLGADELASITARAQRQDATTWTIPELAATLSAAALDELASHFGSKVTTREPAGGAIVLRVIEDHPLRFSTKDVAGSLEGALELAMLDAAARGMNISGALPIALAGGTAAIPQDASPLTVNGGEVALGGAAVQRQGESWHLRLPSGDVARGVSLNSVLMEFFGKYINPVFVEPEQANGLLDVTVASAETIDLGNISAASIDIDFSIRELFIENDVIAGFAEASVGETASAIRAQLSSIPGVDRQIRDRIATMSLSEEIKKQIASIRGSITGAQVRLRDGVASTQITLNVADPRASATQPGGSQLYPLAFTGGVDLQTLSTRNLSVTVPTSLIEKWAGENPQDLVQYFGQRPWPKLLPQGVRVRINGTTYVPVPDPQSFQALAREIAPRVAEAFLQGQLEGVLQRLRE